MSIRILQVVSHLGHRAADQQILALATGLPRDQFELHVCALDCCVSQRRSLEASGVPVTVLGSPACRRDDCSWGVPSRVWKLIRHISRLSPDVVHMWSGDPSNSALPLAAVCFASRVMGAEVLSSQWSAGRVIEVLERFGVRNIVPSVESACLKSASPSGPRKSSATLGIRGLASQSWAQKNVLLREAGLPPGTKLIVAYSDYSAISRFKDAIWTADLLKVIRDDTHLVVIGDGPLHWRGERFRNQVLINDRVHLVTDCCEWEKWIPYANCYWDVDGLSHSLLFTATAMANGVPIIAADTPDSRELLGDDGAMFFTPGHRGGLARNCQEMLEKRELALSFAARGRERASHLLSIDQMVESYVGIYQGAA